MSKKQNSVVEIVKKLSLPIAESLGYEIWDVKFVKEGPTWYLRVYIDKPEGITLDDCEKMSRQLDEPLDELNPTNDMSYCLEVCSPGIERELSTDEHLEKFLGSEIFVKLFSPNEQGDKSVEGVLNSFDENYLEVNTLKIPRKNISCINLKDLKEN